MYDLTRVVYSFLILANECESVWDSIMCWPRSGANKTVSLPCPPYVNKFNTQSKF